MSGVVDPEPVLIQSDEGGTWRVGGTRVTFETIVAAFDRGDSAEETHEQYPTVRLGDAYPVITYYLRNPPSMQVYLNGHAAVGSEVRSVVEDTMPPEGLRARLLARTDR